jgi:excisionase family DNA binding protein
MSDEQATRTGRGLTAQEAAAYLGVKVSTLAKWRQIGVGPPYSARLGRDPRYHKDDLDQFLWGDGVVGNSVEAKHRRRRRRAAVAADQTP